MFGIDQWEMDVSVLLLPLKYSVAFDFAPSGHMIINVLSLASGWQGKASSRKPALILFSWALSLLKEFHWARILAIEYSSV